MLAEFPRPGDADWIKFDSATERKLATKEDSAMGPNTRALLAELNSSAFVDFLERLTGIEGLIPDPHSRVAACIRSNPVATSRCMPTSIATPACTWSAGLTS